MNRTVNIVRMLTVLGAVMLTVVLNLQDVNIASEQQTSQERQISQDWQNGNEQLSVETLVGSQKRFHHEATLTDATSLYRVCSSRPQRILPTHVSKTERTVNRLSE